MCVHTSPLPNQTIAVLDCPAAAHCGYSIIRKLFHMSPFILINTIHGRHHQNRLLYGGRKKKSILSSVFYGGILINSLPFSSPLNFLFSKKEFFHILFLIKIFLLVLLFS